LINDARNTASSEEKRVVHYAQGYTRCDRFMNRSRGASNKKCNVGSETGRLDEVLLLSISFIEESDAKNGSRRFWDVVFIFSESSHHTLVRKAILFSFTLRLLDIFDDGPERIAWINGYSKNERIFCRCGRGADDKIGITGVAMQKDGECRKE